VRHLELKIPPPVLALVFGSAMYACARAAAVLALQIPGRTVLAAALAAAGIAVDLAAAVSFLRARTTINPMKPGSTRALVTSGVYRLSRNPMYVGLTLVMFAWGVHLASALALALAAGFVPCLKRLQILPEERILREKFGSGYDEYARRVRRWI